MRQPQELTLPSRRSVPAGCTIPPHAQTQSHLAWRFLFAALRITVSRPNCFPVKSTIGRPCMANCPRNCYGVGAPNTRSIFDELSYRVCVRKTAQAVLPELLSEKKMGHGQGFQGDTRELPTI